MNDVFLCVTKCVSKKERNGVAYLFFDAGVNVTGGGHANMSHDSFFTMKHFVSNDLINAQLHGPMCFPSDIISVSAPMPKHFRVNDVLIIPNSGAYSITFHIEAAKKPLRTISMIKKLGARAGIAINPKTSEIGRASCRERV